MTILIDELFDGRAYYRGWNAAGNKTEASINQAQRTGARNAHLWCHMTSDVSEEELHAFAARIGLRKSWYQGDHYDLTPGRRLVALRLGAVETDSQGIVDACRKLKGVGIRVSEELVVTARQETDWEEG